MSYRITPYTLAQADKLGVVVKPSKVRGKKLDVFKKSKGELVKIATIGALGYNDYPTFMDLEKKGKVPDGTAEKRRRAYKIRHQKDRTIRGSNGWYADKLLW
jgi:hypothetical protein